MTTSKTSRDQVRSLTPADLLATARKYLDSPNMQIVVVGDRTQIESQARLFGPPQIFDTQGQPSSQPKHLPTEQLVREELAPPGVNFNHRASVSARELPGLDPTMHELYKG